MLLTSELFGECFKIFNLIGKKLIELEKVWEIYLNTMKQNVANKV